MGNIALEPDAVMLSEAAVACAAGSLESDSTTRPETEITLFCAKIERVHNNISTNPTDNLLIALFILPVLYIQGMVTDHNLLFYKECTKLLMMSGCLLIMHNNISTNPTDNLFIYLNYDYISSNNNVFLTPEVTVKEDTLEYNSTAYRTPEGAMLEELVKKLPGAEIDGISTIG